jgi:cadmium resistance transport/sequestration family protein
MNWLVGAIIAGITSFVATNIDDIVILMLFFAQVNATFKPRNIVVGQYLGFTAILVMSLPGFFGGLFIPKTWIGLLGLVPIAMGIQHWRSRSRGFSPSSAEEPEIQTVTTDASAIPLFATLISPETYKVAAVTFANGGDNIGIYVPLFANSNWASLGVIVTIFLLMIGIWCAIAYWLIKHPAIAKILTRYGHQIVPFVLIGIGIFILLESETYKLLH